MPTTDALAAALADRYIIERLIGEGGMAKVYLARDLRHNRHVALKVLRPDLGAVVGIDRFQAEIKVTANLQHPNLLPLFDSGAAGDMLFYVMPYVAGESLRARLDREKQLPVDEAVRLSTAIAGALDYAHRQGVIHRDLKPENVLLQEGQPLIADFGIALAVSNAGASRITQTGLSLGTPHYMSPEQATGDRLIDGRTDIYSLGALTYEMLTGEPPHTGATSQAVIARVLTERPRSIRASRPSVPEHVEAAIDVALEKLPADRWPAARDFADAIVGIRPNRTPTSALASAHAVGATRSRRRETAAWAVAGLLALVLGYVGVRSLRPVPPPPPAEFEVTIPDDLQIGRTGSASSIALSRDGRILVFVGQKPDGQRMLYTRRIDDRVVQEIRGSEGAFSPVLSPDASEVLFGGGTGALGTVRRIDIRGGVPRTFAESGPRNGQISWGERNQVVMANPDTLWLIDAESGVRKALATPDQKRNHFQYGFPCILPGGRSALISIWKGRFSADSIVIGTVSIPDGKVTELGIRGLYPRYSATGHLIYANSAGLLSAVPFDAKSLKVLGSPVQIAEGVLGGTGGAVPLAVADDGTMAFVQGGVLGGMVELAIVDRSGHQRLLPLPRGYYASPRVSPDGKQVTFSRAEGPVGGGATSIAGPDVWRLDFATNQPVRVTTDKESDRPIWSRDGSEILFSRPADSSLFAIPLWANAQPRALLSVHGTIGTTDFGPAHGYGVIGVTTRGNPDLWIVPMDSLGKARPFIAEPYVEAIPRVSPDGRLVAYQSGRTGIREVYIRQLPSGGEEVKVSVADGTDPVWSRDGTELFFRTLSQMMVARISRTPKLTASLPRPLFALTNYAQIAVRSTYDVFPNGEFLMLATGSDTVRTRTPLVVRLNWTSGLGADKPTKR